MCFRLRLLDAIPAVKEALCKDKITLGHVLEIARFAPDVQAELLRFCFTDRWNQKRPEAASISELQRFNEETILLDLKKAAFDTNDLPHFVARHLWRTWTVVHRVLMPDAKTSSASERQPRAEGAIANGAAMATAVVTAGSPLGSDTGHLQPPPGPRSRLVYPWTPPAPMW